MNLTCKALLRVFQGEWCSTVLSKCIPFHLNWWIKTGRVQMNVEYYMSKYDSRHQTLNNKVAKQKYTALYNISILSIFVTCSGNKENKIN